MIVGTIASATRPPDPASTPYPDAVICLHLKAVETLQGAGVPAEILVYAMGMRQRRWTPLAGLGTGDQLQVRVVGWSQVEKEYGGLYRDELDGLWDLPVYWGQPVPQP